MAMTSDVAPYYASKVAAENCSDPVRMPEIQGSLEDINRALHMIQEMFDELRIKIGPACASPVPVEMVKANQVGESSAQTEIGQRLQQMRRHAEDIANAIADVNRRCEL